MPVAVGVNVGVAEGVRVNVGVAVGVGVSVAVGVNVGVKVAVALGVGVFVALASGVREGVRDGATVGVTGGTPGNRLQASANNASNVSARVSRKERRAFMSLLYACGDAPGIRATHAFPASGRRQGIRGEKTGQNTTRNLRFRAIFVVNYITARRSCLYAARTHSPGAPTAA